MFKNMPFLLQTNHSLLDNVAATGMDISSINLITEINHNSFLSHQMCLVFACKLLPWHTKAVGPNAIN